LRAGREGERETGWQGERGRQAGREREGDRLAGRERETGWQGGRGRQAGREREGDRLAGREGDRLAGREGDVLVQDEAHGGRRGGS
jgi:hypothetical protein